MPSDAIPCSSVHYIALKFYFVTHRSELLSRLLAGCYDDPSPTPRIEMLSNHPSLRTLTVAVTGASGSIFPRVMLDLLDRDERVGRINLIVSDSGMRVMAEELEISGRNDL